MSDQRFIAYVFGVVVILLHLAACGTSSTVIVPTATATSELSTATPNLTPTNTPVTETSTATSTPALLLSVTKTENIVYAQRTQPKEYEWKLDEYTPAEPGAWPIVIFIHGLGGNKSSYQDLGQALASQGMTVFVISYPDIPPLVAIDGNARGYREMTETAACAVRYAHARAVELGNDTPSITIAGFSLGGGLGTYVALVEDSLESQWEAYATSNGGKPVSKTVCESDDRIEVDSLVGSRAPMMYLLDLMENTDVRSGYRRKMMTSGRCYILL